MRNTEADPPLINPDSIAEDYMHVVAALIWNQQRAAEFLIAQRPKGKHLEDYWEFPGGKREAGETPLQALCRELDEELGIEVLAAAPYLQVYHRYPERNVLLDIWEVDRYRGELHAAEQQTITWVKVAQMDAYRFPPADLPVLDVIRNSARA